MKSIFSANYVRIEDCNYSLKEVLEFEGFETSEEFSGMVTLKYPLYTNREEAKKVYRQAQKELSLTK